MILNKKEIKQIRENGEIHKIIFKEIKKYIKPGVSALEINNLSGELCKKHNVLPGFKGVYDFPANICISINDVVVHGVPNRNMIFKDGDVVKFDFGVKDKNIGINTDAAFTQIIGDGPYDRKVKKFLETNKKALKVGIKKAKVGNTTGDIGFAIQNEVENNGFFVVKDLTGHGLGYEVHEKPYIYNYGTPGKGAKLKENMLIAIEPIIGFTSGKIIDKGGFDIYIADGSIGSQFEHTVLITKDGPEIIV